MFDWFWKFLYGISQSLFRVCDWLIECAMKLIGISPIYITDATGKVQESDFLTYLLRSDDIWFAFISICTLAFIILILFTVIAIIRAIGKEGSNMTPTQICVKCFKCVLTFMCVPTLMFLFTWFINEFMFAVYKATLHGSSSIGSFLFVSFAQDAGLSASERTSFLNGSLSYLSWGDVDDAIEVSDFDFIMSWIVGFIVMYNISLTLLMFVDRAISIVILFIAAPFSIASSVLDDGARFKTWRDQVISKYLAGYGSVIAINIYCLVCSAITSNGFEFFADSDTLNNVAKILIMLGGALTMKKAMGLVGSLISSTAAGDVNDPAFAKSALAGAALSAAKFAGGVAKSPFTAARGITNFAKDASRYGLGSTIGSRLGFKTEKDYNAAGWKPGGGGGSSGDDNNNSENSENQNENKPDYNNGVSLNDALNGGNDKNDDKKGNRNDMLGNAMSGTGDGSGEDKNNNTEGEE